MIKRLRKYVNPKSKGIKRKIEKSRKAWRTIATEEAEKN